MLPAAQGIGEAMTRAQIAAARRARLKTLFAWARPWQHHALSSRSATSRSR
jgi:hypothetical protein